MAVSRYANRRLRTTPQQPEMTPLFDTADDLGLTDMDLAEAAGVSPNNISQVRRGLVCPNYRTAKKLAEALGFRVLIVRNDALPTTNKEKTDDQKDA